MKKYIFILMFITAQLCAFKINASGLTQDELEHGTVGSTNTYQQRIAPEKYWFYEISGRLKDIKESDQSITGLFSERMRTYSFIVEKEKTRNIAAKTEGFKLFIEHTIALMAPDAVPTNEANQKHLQEMKTKMEVITGLKFTNYKEWNVWFKKNKAKLKWSVKENKLLSE